MIVVVDVVIVIDDVVIAGVDASAVVSSTLRRTPFSPYKAIPLE